MNLSSLELEHRIGCVLEDALRERAQLGDLSPAQLAGLGKKLKKVAKKIGKVVRKVAPIALGAGALYFGGKALVSALAKKGAGKAAAQVLPEAADAVAQAVASGAVPAAPVEGAAPGSQAFIDAASQIAQAVMASRAPSMPHAVQPIVQDAVRAQMGQPDPFAPVDQPVQAGMFPGFNLPPWALPVGAVLLGGGILYALTRDSKR